jgi:KAP family P-loop domain
MSTDERRTAFLTDSPEPLDASSDAFGHRDYAEAVAETLIAAPTPFTVGVFGPWGVGKSTIIGEVRRRLPDRVGFAYYDAWRYEGDALRRQLLRDVARQLHESKQLRGFDPEKDLEELEVTVQETREGIEFSWPRFLRSLIGALLLAAIVYLFLRDRQGAALFSGHEPLTDAGVGALVFLASGLLTLLREPFQVTQRVLGTQRLEEPDRFAAKFEQLMACVRSERVVIAIDNLDRCSPDRAVEILSTIKTYLEPAIEPDSARRWLPPLRADGQAPKPAVFLIAADIDALRRHLLSKELEGAGQPPGEAGRYVDEYLRKFFSATLPIRASLDTEMRSYVASQLAELVRAAKLDERERKKLIEMVAAALGRNPRRVKQFANNLEIRLLLLAARETEVPGHSAMIRPPISDRPLEVAKLALIEEEWPAYFKALFAQPRCLQQWELAARGVGQLGPGVAGPPPELPRDIDGGVGNWPALAAFLRASDGVSIENPRPFLRLKQSETEVRLPGFAEFTESIAAGEREAAMALLEQASEEQRRGLEAELPAVLARELDESYIQGALQVVDLVVSQSPIDTQIRSLVLYNAVSDPRIKNELARLDPRLLLAAGRGLQLASYRELQTLVADRLQSGDAGESEQRAIAVALSGLGNELSADAREHIRLACDQSSLPQRPDVVAIFAGFDDSLVSEQTMHRQLQQFVGGQAQASKPGQLESSMRIVLAGIREHRDKQAAETIAEYISTALTNEVAQASAIEDTELYAQALEAIAPVAPERVASQSRGARCRAARDRDPHIRPLPCHPRRRP